MSAREGLCRALQWRSAASLFTIGALLATPIQAAAQAVPSDELRELIPDSAVNDPESWALEQELPPESVPPLPSPSPLPGPEAEADAASMADIAKENAAATPDGSQAAPGAQGLPASTSDLNRQSASDAAPSAPAAGSGEEDLILPDTPMLPMPGITVPWPDDMELPKVQPLEPDPVVEEAERNAPPLTSFSDGQVIVLGDGVELNLPGNNTNFSVRDEFIQRFQSLSAINALEDDNPNIAQLTARARQDEELLNSLLRVYGYYDALVIRSITGAKAGTPNPAKDAVVRFDIRPGTRYKFDQIDLGKLQTAPDGVDLRSAFAIQPGDPVDSDDIVREQADLQNALEESGYPFYDMGEAELLIDHDTESGNLSLPVDPGPKSSFGTIISQQPDFLSSKHLQGMARFKPGQIYQQSKVDDLRQAILATGLVSTVEITPRPLRAGAAAAALASGTEPETLVQDALAGPIQNVTLRPVALDVDLTPAPLRTISGQIGYGTQEGFRIQGYWENRNIFPSEGLLQVRGVLGTEEQLVGLTVRKNNFRGRDKVLTFDAYGRASSTPAYEAQTISLQGEFERDSTVIYQKRWSWAVGFQLQGTRERQRNAAGVSTRQDYLIVSVPARVLYDTSDSLLNPTKGFRLGANISPEVSRRSGKTAQYNKVELEGSYYKEVNDKVIVAGRMAVGSIIGASIDDIAPSRRFYAGGGSSVRGYGYQDIGPRNASGEPEGGRSLVELNVEARVKTKYFDGALSLVPFIDAGAVGADALPDAKDIKVGAGIGVRYETGFGPIRVDLGVPLNPDPGDKRFAVYVSLGQAF